MSLHGRAFIKRCRAILVRQKGEICKVRLAFDSLGRHEDARIIGFLREDKSQAQVALGEPNGLQGVGGCASLCAQAEWITKGRTHCRPVDERVVVLKPWEPQDNVVSKWGH
jgi:hypothetical protein